MIISLCIPCHARVRDLKAIMPHLIEAGRASPPVEIAVVDYSSPDELGYYMSAVNLTESCDEVKFAYRRYYGCSYYRMAHARNLSAMLASGEYIVISSADLWFDNGFIPEIRERITGGCVWMGAKRYCGVLGIKRQAFVEAGGFDERFEFYGPEDRDLELRMRRRGEKFGELSYKYIHDIPTPNEEKVKNYRLDIGKRGMADAMHPILEENIANNVMVANAGKEWGQWR
jgi:hypothetical protein